MLHEDLAIGVNVGSHDSVVVIGIEGHENHRNSAHRIDNVLALGSLLANGGFFIDHTAIRRILARNSIVTHLAGANLIVPVIDHIRCHCCYQVTIIIPAERLAFCLDHQITIIRKFAGIAIDIFALDIAVLVVVILADPICVVDIRHNRRCQLRAFIIAKFQMPADRAASRA